MKEIAYPRTPKKKLKNGEEIKKAAKIFAVSVLALLAFGFVPLHKD
ncbi:hypothetical protein [Chryseobacterium profundimaris]|uniref:Energy transducer TonB n=1 Tax=Chryseobacterium profundimaris TaxID=1387275 RepID=A0ABY1P6S2_9FLAO|nr:hypothetical protein [Chryseobacterium profundimaris]SMP27760.1 hypothetical protein SAMN06264346_11036 [Chryseobacterium profundimaris]